MTLAIVFFTIEEREQSVEEKIKKSLNKCQWIILMVMLLLALSLVFIQSRRNEIGDDAFITYRYAANLVKGNGLLYNKNEAILGTTTPGYALILAGFSFPFGAESIPIISRALNLILATLLSVNLGLIVFRLSSDCLLSALASLVVFILPNTMESVANGMETTLFLFMLSVGLFFLIGERYSLTGFIWGLMVWVRPEAVFIACLFFVEIIRLFYKKEITFKKVMGVSLLMGLPCILYIGFNLFGYGSLLPHSIAAKSRGLYPLTVAGSLWQVLANLMGSTARLFSFLPDIVIIIMIVLVITLKITLPIIALRELVTRKNSLWIMPAFYLCLLLFYATSRTLLFSWYFANYELLGFIVTTAGLFYLINRITNTHKQWHSDLIGKVLVVVLMVCIAVPQPWSKYVSQKPTYPFVSSREKIYYDTFLHTLSFVPADVRIAMPEIGVLGFFLIDNYIMDTAGLVTTEVLDYLPVASDERPGPLIGVIPPDYIREYAPDMIVSFEIFGKDGLFSTAWFTDTYELLHQIDGIANQDWDGGDLLIFTKSEQTP